MTIQRPMFPPLRDATAAINAAIERNPETGNSPANPSHHIVDLANIDALSANRGADACASASIMTRRSLVNALVPVASILSASAMSATAGDTAPDSDLLRLGAQFDVLAARWQAIQAEYDRRAEDPQWQRIKRLIRDFVRRENARGASATSQRWYLALDKARTERDDYLGLDALITKNEGVTVEMAPVQEAILAATATTLAGLRVKARSAAFACSRWYGREGADWDQELANDVIQAVLTLPGRGASSAALAGAQQ